MYTSLELISPGLVLKFLSVYLKLIFDKCSSPYQAVSETFARISVPNDQLVSPNTREVSSKGRIKTMATTPLRSFGC